MDQPLTLGTRRIALGVEYDGRAFCGWQTQPPRSLRSLPPGGAQSLPWDGPAAQTQPPRSLRSLSPGGAQSLPWDGPAAQTQPIGCGVQDVLEAALAQIHGAPLATIVAGRTDAGVHATGQVLHFDAVNARPESAWVRGVNAHLPPGVAVLWAREVSDDFHARFGALEREYRYRLLMRPVRPAILAGRVGWVHGDLDVAAMQVASRCLIGTHDFSAFRSAECQAKSPVREMRGVELVQDGPILEFTFRANAFLQHQIRNLVGALVWVGQGRRPPEWMAETLAGRDRTRAAATFAPDGLYLAAVRYDQCYALPENILIP